MSNLWGRDDRIEDGTALRDLEKKVHFLMSLVAGQMQTRGGNDVSIPDDIFSDSMEVTQALPSNS